MKSCPECREKRMQQAIIRKERERRESRLAMGPGHQKSKSALAWSISNFSKTNRLIGSKGDTKSHVLHATFGILLGCSCPKKAKSAAMVQDCGCPGVIRIEGWKAVSRVGEHSIQVWCPKLEDGDFATSWSMGAFGKDALIDLVRDEMTLLLKAPAGAG